MLVSETVRALTQTVLPVTFAPRGRKALKGVAEPVAVFSVSTSADAWAPARNRRRRLALIGAAAGVVVVLVAAVGWVRLHPVAALPPGTWKIGVDLPITGAAAFRGLPASNAIRLAMDEADAAGGIDGSPIQVDLRDDNGGTPDTAQDPATGVRNTAALAADPPAVVAMIGPWQSRVASKEIPLTNAAGLLQCSPANTDPALTKPRGGALDLRAAHPDQINYIRTAPADDIQGPALASFIFHDLNASRTLVVDDGDQGREIADDFSTAYAALGGQTVRRTLNPGADPKTVLDALDDPSNRPGAVFFGGFTGTGAATVRSVMATTGHAAIPFVSWDGIQDGSGGDDGSFIQLAGDAAARLLLLARIDRSIEGRLRRSIPGEVSLRAR